MRSARASTLGATRVALGMLALAAVGSVACLRAIHEAPAAAESHRAAGADRLSRSTRSNREPASAARIALGRRIFFDTNLSEPSGMSCATCHDPELGFAGVNGSTNGLPRGSRPGHFARRNTPSLLYLKYVPRFYFHAEEHTLSPEARGGFFWDGRANSLADLVSQPLLNADEMNNRDASAVADKLRGSAYVAELGREFGARTLDTTDGTMHALGASVEAFLLSDAMAPFSSKFDDYLRGRAKLSPLETRGLTLFDDPRRGNCSSCHRVNLVLRDPERSLFSDFGYEAVAAPRNRALPVNADPGSFDLGLCEREVAGPNGDRARFCGSFRTPSLRNVALRPTFMHNGVFKRLRDVVAFYATRGTDPSRWYTGGPFDDLPPQHRGRIDTTKAPYDRAPGMPPRLDDGDVGAIVAFLGTLTDRAKPPDR